MANVLLSEVNKVYRGGFEVVKNFTLEIRDGEFVILVGPSGCGKSTTLRMIAGLESITSGKLWIDGELANFLEPGERDLSMVFQNYALYPYMTVFENMAFSLRCEKMEFSEIDKRVREAAGMLQIEHLLFQKPNALSGGQKQRVAIGSVLVRRPKLFLMDEPLSNLDAKLRTQMRVELAKLHKQLGATIVYVTHDQVEAMTLGTRIVVMKEGIIQQVATPNELYSQPVNQFVAGFIGSPAMNFVAVKVCPFGERMVLCYDGGSLSVPIVMEQKLRNRGYMGRDLILGIRPEDLHSEGQDDCRIPMNVTLTENLGAEVLLHGELCGSQACAKMSPSFQVEPQAQIWLYPDLTMAKLFDNETEENILYTGVRG